VASRSSVRARQRILLATAIEMARLANRALAKAGLAEAVVVGETRRGVEIVSELQMIVRGPCDVGAIARALRGASACENVEVVDAESVSMRFEGGGPARLTVVPQASFVEAQLRRTGSPSHVRWLASLAGQGGLTAVCRRSRTEDEVYAALGVPFAPPELREGATRRVPELVCGVHGVFHVHTTWSDGSATIADMAKAAQEAGYGYLGITEHSKAASYARGLDAKQLHQQARALVQARRSLPHMTLLHGVEVDVMPDGTLDLDDATLASLDFVIASVHVALDMNARDMTARLLRAVRHPLVTILGHPTGRLLLGRKASAFDVEAVASAAAGNDTFLEINANPQRLDLGEDLVRRAAAEGARFAIDPDAHSPRGIRDTDLGISVARRAGLAPSQVLNTRNAEEVAGYLSSRRRKAKRALALA
jgi:DNA polymerase (family 10)